MAAFSTANAQQALFFNEINADPAGDLIGDANGDGTRSSSQDEFVELANMSADSLDLTGWMLGDDEAINFTFPDGYKLAPRHLLVVFGGGDVTGEAGMTWTWTPPIMYSHVQQAAKQPNLKTNARALNALLVSKLQIWSLY